MSATGAGARRVVVGVAGSVSAYKAPFVIRLLRRAGHEVEVVATAAALRFIGEPALAAVSGGPMATDFLRHIYTSFGTYVRACGPSSVTATVFS